MIAEAVFPVMYPEVFTKGIFQVSAGKDYFILSTNGREYYVYVGKSAGALRVTDVISGEVHTVEDYENLEDYEIVGELMESMGLGEYAVFFGDTSPVYTALKSLNLAAISALSYMKITDENGVVEYAIPLGGGETFPFFSSCGTKYFYVDVEELEEVHCYIVDETDGAEYFKSGADPSGTYTEVGGSRTLEMELTAPINDDYIGELIAASKTVYW